MINLGELNFLSKHIFFIFVLCHWNLQANAQISQGTPDHI